MNKFILYFTFLILLTGVFISLLLTYRYVKVDKSGLKSRDLQTNSSLVNYTNKYNTELENSWLTKIQLEYKDEPYFYAISEVKIVLN